MATSEDILIADEIVAELNAQQFSQPVIAERMFFGEWDLKDELEDLQVGVIPGNSSMELWERQQNLEAYDVVLIFAKRVAKKSRDKIDALADLVTEIKDFLAPNDDPKSVLLSDGRRYDFLRWAYITRIAALKRTKTAAGDVEYSGTFGSALMFEYQASE